MNKWENTLPSIGLKMKTGLTVDFRNKEALRDAAEEHAVPLFYSQHIQNGKVVFPVGRNMSTWLLGSGGYCSQTKIIFLSNGLQQKKNIGGFNVVFIWQKSILSIHKSVHKTR